MTPSLHMTGIPIDFTTRTQLVHVQHVDNAFDDFYLLNIYAPSGRHRERHQFFDSLHQTLQWLIADQVNPDRLFIMGDFNYDIHRSGLHLNAPTSWLTWLESSFTNCIHDDTQFDGVPTFRHSSSSSAIDYINAANHLSSSICNRDVAFINQDWTDHALLSATFIMGQPKTGKGYWRGNPLLFQQAEFCRQLNDALTSHFMHLHTMSSAQDKWESVKHVIINNLKTFSRRQSHWQKQQLAALQSKRNRFLRSKPPPAIRAWRLPIMERQIAALQQELADIDALRAGQRWRERGETTAGYLKRTIKERQVKRTITTLQHPDTGMMCVSPSDLHSAVQCFYQRLYSPEPTSASVMETLLSQLPTHLRLDDPEQAHLVHAFTLEDLLNAASRTPHHSSPGPDGLPYQAWRLVFAHPLYATLVMEVYEGCFATRSFPKILHWYMHVPFAKERGSDQSHQLATHFFDQLRCKDFHSVAERTDHPCCFILDNTVSKWFHAGPLYWC